MTSLAETAVKRILRATATAFAVGFAKESAWRLARNLLRNGEPVKKKAKVRK